jgi:cell division protein FtsB
VKEAVSELSRRPRISIWSRFNVVLGLALAVGLVIAVTYRNLPWVKEKAAQDARATELTTKLENARMLNQRLNREVNRLQNDPEFLAVFARDRVVPGYMKPGETIFRIDRNERSEPPPR